MSDHSPSSALFHFSVSLFLLSAAGRSFFKILKLRFANLLIPVVLIAAVVSSLHVSRLSDVYFYPNWTQLYLGEKHGDIVICRVILGSGIGQAVTRIPATDGG